MPKKPKPEKEKPVTVKELDELLLKLLDVNKRLDAKEDETKVINKEKMGIQGKISAHLDQLERTEYNNPDIGTFKTEEKWRVNMPANDLDKEKFFAHLRKRELFDKLATVNSNSLNALYMADWKEAKRLDPAAAMTFTMPGIPAAERFLKPSFKAAKK